MKTFPSLGSLLVLATLLATGCGTVSQPQPLPANITVTYHEPDKFTDARSTFGGSTDEGYLDLLSDHVRRAASRFVQPDQKLEITVTDVDLAGDFIPVRAGLDDVRIIKEIYRPRITLSFKLTGPGGTVVKQGDRTLVDSFFMHNVGVIGRNEPLFYDKTLLDDWVRNEFKP